MADLTSLPLQLDAKKRICRAIIETPKGCRNKFDYDPDSGLFMLGGLLPEGMMFPFDFGFIPSTLGDDGDPLDICVVSERAIMRNEIIVRARVVGGLQMIDAGEADDKIIAVLDNDHVWGTARNLADIPDVFVERLQHYFLTYKMVPGRHTHARVTRVYSRNHALRVVRAAITDYKDNFGG